MKLLDYAEAAALLRIAPSTLRVRVMKKQVPFLKPFGKRGRTLFLLDDLERFILGSRTEMEK